MKIDCNGCTDCCKIVGLVLANKDNVPEYSKDAVRDFPYKAKDNYSCEMLTEDGCSVYEDRPDLCRVDVMAKRQTDRTPEEHFEYAKESCKYINDFFSK